MRRSQIRPALRRHPDEPAPEPASDDADGIGSNAEAARYRTRLREAEAERDALASTLTGLQRDQVIALAGKHLRNGADLLDLADVQLANLLAEDGTVDAAKVEAAATAALEHRSYLGHPTIPPPLPGQGAGSGQGGEREPKSLSDILGMS